MPRKDPAGNEPSQGGANYHILGKMPAESDSRQSASHCQNDPYPPPARIHCDQKRRQHKSRKGMARRKGVKFAPEEGTMGLQQEPLIFSFRAHGSARVFVDEFFEARKVFCIGQDREFGTRSAGDLFDDFVGSGAQNKSYQKEKKVSAALHV